MDRGVAMTGTIAFDLATLELDQFAHAHRKNKLAKQIADASLGIIYEGADESQDGCDDDNCLNNNNNNINNINNMNGDNNNNTITQ